MKTKTKYTKDLPKRLYSFFTSFVTSGVTKDGAPSFSKFARSINVTLEDVESFRNKKEFDRAYRECSEIRKDYLIDSALTKRMDSSLVKFLLDNEFSEESSEDTSLTLTLEVIDGDKK